MKARLHSLIAILALSAALLPHPTLQKAGSTQHESKGELKTAELRKRSKQSAWGTGGVDGIIELESYKDYKSFVETGPRPYTTVMVLTAKDCAVCDQVIEQMGKVSLAYQSNGALETSKDGKFDPVFFFHAKHGSKTHKIFVSLGLNSVPYVVTTPASFAKVKEEDKAEFMKDKMWHITASTAHGAFTVQKLMEYVNKKTKRNVQYKPPITHLLLQLALVAVFGCMAYLIFVKWKWFLLHHRFWFVASLIVCFVCQSGFIFNILHNVPLTQTDNKGNVKWYANGRSQLAAEGYIMSGCFICAGLMFVLVHYLSSRFESDAPEKQMMLAVLLLASIIILQFIEGVYKDKGNYYQLKFFPPRDYKKGHWTNDQRNNI